MVRQDIWTQDSELGAMLSEPRLEFEINWEG